MKAPVEVVAVRYLRSEVVASETRLAGRSGADSPTFAGRGRDNWQVGAIGVPITEF